MPRTPEVVTDPPARPARTPREEAPVRCSSAHRRRPRAGLAVAGALALAAGGVVLGSAVPAAATVPVRATVPVPAAGSAPETAAPGDTAVPRPVREEPSDAALSGSDDEPPAGALIALSFAATGTGLVITAHRIARRR
jgi:hypothetical protein